MAYCAWNIDEQHPTIFQLHAIRKRRAREEAFRKQRKKQCIPFPPQGSKSGFFHKFIRDGKFKNNTKHPSRVSNKVFFVNMNGILFWQINMFQLASILIALKLLSVFPICFLENVCVVWQNCKIERTHRLEMIFSISTKQTFQGFLLNTPRFCQFQSSSNENIDTPMKLEQWNFEKWT